MGNQALNYIQSILDKATQKGTFNLAEVANIIAALEELNKVVNPEKEQPKEN